MPVPRDRLIWSSSSQDMRRRWLVDADWGVALPRRGKRFRLRHGPGLAEARIAGAVDQFARAQRRIEPRERLHLGGRCALREMDRPDLLRVIEPGSGNEFGQRMQRGAMIIVDPLDLVRHHQRASAGWILRGYAGRTSIGIARAISNAVAIFPAAPMRMRSRALMPISALWTKLTPSRIGMPRWSMNSRGAAPVPPSLPSTTMKSG